MPVQFSCPSCGKSLKAKEEMAGRMAKCPYCQAQVQVPEAVAPAEEVPVAAEEMPVDSYAVQATPEAPPREDRRPCPMCGEMIKNDAVKCRFCGEVFDETLKRSEKRRKGASRADSELSGVDLLLCILCSGIGCIVGIVYAAQGKPKGAKMIGLSLIFVVLWNIVNFAIQAALRH